MSNWHCPFIYHVHIESRCKIIKGYFIPRRNFALNTSWSVGTQKNYIDGSRIWVFFFLVEFETNEYYVGVWPQRKNCFFTLEYCLKYLTLLFCHLHTHTTPPCLPMSESWIYLAAEKICTKWGHSCIQQIVHQNRIFRDATDVTYERTLQLLFCSLAGELAWQILTAS